MKVNGNMNALPLLVFSVVVAGSLGGYAGYQGFPHPIPAPYLPFPYNVVGGPAPLPIAPTLRFAPAQPANLPQHYYTPPGNTYRGFSYETDYPNGGSSQVVFVTGPQSRQLMQRSFESFRNIKPDQAKLRVLTVTPTPETNLRVLTVATPLETNSTPATTTVDSISVANPTPAPLANSPPLSLPNPVFTGNPTASVYRVQVFPSHLPQYPHFFQAPFPYHPQPLFTSFYNAVPQLNATDNTLPMQANPDPIVMQQDSANDAQESMINEVGALPALISNRIDSPITAPAAEPASTAQTLSTAVPFNSSPEPVATTTVQQTSSMESVATSSQEPITMEAAVASSAPESSSVESVATSSQEPITMEAAVASSAPESASVESVATSSQEPITMEAASSAPESASMESVATTSQEPITTEAAVASSAPESASTEAAVTSSAPESSSIESVATSSQESVSIEAGTTQAQESASSEGVTSESIDIAGRIQTEVSTEAAEVGTTSENTPSMEGGASETSETTSTASVSEESNTPAATTEPSANSGMDEQITAEQTTEA